MNRMPLFRVVVALVAVAALALPAMAKDDALSLVPANAVTVGMVKLADMRTSPLSSLLCCCSCRCFIHYYELYICQVDNKK